MLSVWPETTQLYRGTSVAMVQVRGKRVLVLEHAQPIALAQMLDALSSSLAEQGTLGNGRTRRLRITLSAALCPAFVFVAPKQVTRWAERLEIARATAALAMDTAPEQLVCEIDAARPGLASAITVQTMSALHGWAAQHRWAITSMQPLWVNATQCRSAGQAAVHGLMLMEPDATTVLANTGTTSQMALTQLAQRSSSDGQAGTRRMLIGLGLTDGEVLRLVFGTKAHTVMQHGPTAWPGHWVSP